MKYFFNLTALLSIDQTANACFAHFLRKSGSAFFRTAHSCIRARNCCSAPSVCCSNSKIRKPIASDFFLFRRQQARIPPFKAHFPAFLHISSPKPLHEQIERIAPRTAQARCRRIWFSRQTVHTLVLSGLNRRQRVRIAEVSQPSAASIP